MKEVIAFATLFLGLTVGPHSVEVIVDRDVAAVEILVDGETIARLEAPPWKAICHLGEQLEPRDLEAVAYSADGVEIGRTSQWLNIPRAPARADVFLDVDPASGQVTARLRSNSLSSETPDEVTVLFDGQEVPTADTSRIILPPHDADQLHYLRVDTRFPDGLTSTVERTFGGGFADEVETELTAVPLQLEPSSLGIAPDSTGLSARGTELSVVDIVSGPADIILVRDQGSQALLDRMVPRRVRDFSAVASLKRGHSLQFLRPVAEQIDRSDIDLYLFGPSATFTSRDGGLFWLLTSIRAREVASHLQRLSDALAVAGLSASATGHRRAVLLVLGPDPADFSQYTPSGVRHYLTKIRVPLIVWSTTGARNTPWGPAVDASTMSKLERQTKRLVKTLEQQRIAWVRGIYLPQEITLPTGQPGIRLAGS